MHELTFDEIGSVSGGIVPAVLGVADVGVVAAVAFGVGVFNGYMDEQQKAKVKSMKK